MDNVIKDEVGNVIACLNMSKSGPNIYLTAQMDTNYGSDEDHTAALDSEKLTGPSIADNSVGLSSLINLARIIGKASLQLDANIFFLSTVGSQGKGYSTGIRSVVEEMGDNIDAMIGVEGIKLGRIGHYFKGCRILDITCRVPEDGLKAGGVKPNAVSVIAEIIHKVGGLKLPSAPDVEVNFGFVRGGEDYDKVATYSRCGIELLSMNPDSLAHVENRIRFWVSKIALKMSAEAQIERLRNHPSGNIPEDHFMVHLVKDVNTFLKVKSVPGYSSPDISVPLSKGIPSVTIAVSEGSVDKGNETILINPLATGMKQLLLTVAALTARWNEYTTLPVW
jgi:hypothetical protein